MHSFLAICTSLEACCFHNLSRRERVNEGSCLQRGECAKQEKKWRAVQSGCAWASEWEKVRVGWPCYQLGWVGQAGRRLLSMGRDRQMLALLPGQNISPGAGSTQSGPGSCNPNDHWWRCTWPTDQLHTHWALPLPFPPHSPALSLLFDLQHLPTQCRNSMCSQSIGDAGHWARVRRW